MRKEISRVIGILLGLSLLLGWRVGISPKDSAALANREVTTWPFQNINEVIQAEKWLTLNTFLLDRLRIKTQATSWVNNFFIQTTGMTISSQVIAWPIRYKENHSRSVSPESDLFYSQDFTNACGEITHLKSAEISLSKLEDLNKTGRIQIRFVIASNKSSFTMDSNYWSNALLACSIKAHESIEGLSSKLENPSIFQVLPKEAWESNVAPPYWRGDTHWTPLGALEVPNFLIEEELLKSTALARLDVGGKTNGTRVEDLWAMLGTKNVLEVSYIRSKFPNQTYELTSKDNVRHFQTQQSLNVDSRRILFVYDSFGFVPELENQIAPMYEESYFVKWADFNPTNLPKVDIIIFESVERYSLSRLNKLQDLEITLD